MNEFGVHHRESCPRPQRRV